MITAGEIAPIIANGAASDVFVRKSDASGKPIWDRRFPDLFGAGALPMVIDANDDVYLAGGSVSPDAFPFTSILLTGALAAPSFVVKLRGSDGTIAWAAEIDGQPTAITVNSNGEAIVAVASSPVTLQTTPGAYTSGQSGSNLDVATSLIGISPAGDKAVFALEYGGIKYACATGMQCAGEGATVSASAVMLDSQGNIWIAGTTTALDLPLTSDAIDKTCGCNDFGGGDGFLAKFSADGTKLLYATYFGSAPSTPAADDGADTIAAAVLDSSGHIWMAGTTNGAGLPVTLSTHKSSPAGDTSWFVAEFDPAANTFPWASYFGSDSATVAALVTAPGNTLILEGTAVSTADLPIVPSGFTRGQDFAALLDAQARAFTSATTFPAGAADAGIAFTPSGAPMVAGAGNVAAVLDTAGSGGPSIYGITSSAGLSATGQASAGELITLYGAGIGPAVPVTAGLVGGAFPKMLAGVQVLVNGQPVPIIYASSDQINAVVPFGIGSSTTLDLVLNNGSAASNHASLQVQDATPDAFKANANGQAAALNQDGSRNDRTPAAEGSIVQVFATGFGEMYPQPTDGAILTGTLPMLTFPVQVLWKGQPLHVTYAGPAPSLVAGAIQVNFRLPQPMTSGPQSFQFQVGSRIGGPFVLQLQ